MAEIVIIVGLVATVTAVSAMARRLGILAPILLVLVGIVASYIPGVPSIQLHPDLVLMGFLPLLLYAAAIETSVPAFRLELRAILLLSVGLVLVTAICVGVILHEVVPGLPLSAAFALGAVVAPPDAVAATAIARRVGLPRRMVTILEGESLVNDATALVTLRVAVAAALGETVTATEIAFDALLAVVGGIGIGLVVAWGVAQMHRRITDPLIGNAVSLLTPFVAYLPAELIDSSGVVAVVVCGLYLGHHWSSLTSATSRLQMSAVWQMTRFLLEGVVFLLVGLQLREIISNLTIPTSTLISATAAVVGTVLVVRFVVVYSATYLMRLVPWKQDSVPPLSIPTVIGWAGMRGVVTLAAAFTLPVAEADGPFPYRSLLIWLAFAVIAATLVLQGSTLPTVIRWAKVPPDDPRQDALAEAVIQHEARQAALLRLDEVAGDAPTVVVEQLRQAVEKQANHAWERLGRPRQENPSNAYRRLRREMLQAEREVFLRAHAQGRIPESVLHRVQREMDLREALLYREEGER